MKIQFNPSNTYSAQPEVRDEALAYVLAATIPEGTVEIDIWLDIT